MVTLQKRQVQRQLGQLSFKAGVSASTWERIIAREQMVKYTQETHQVQVDYSNNAWMGINCTVKDQINAAVKAYNAQGLSLGV